MQCRFPPALTDDQITQAVDGQADQAVQMHLAQCEGCAARLGQAQQLEQSVRLSLGRWDCPSAQQLTDYQFGLLDPSESVTITRHLSTCIGCSAELAQLRVFLEEDVALSPEPQLAPTRSVHTRLRELVAQIVPRSPAMALRGAGHEPIIAQVEATTIVLDVQATSAGFVRVIGQVVAEDQDVWNGALVEIRQAGAVLALATVDDVGGFESQNIPSGTATIRITPAGGQPSVLVPEVVLAAEA